EVPDAEDVALFLHTSGTEDRPKAVPLTHSNVLQSAQHIASHYGLTPADRSLIVMPLFHGHGLIGAALATLASGGTMIVPPRFSASRFWGSFRRIARPGTPPCRPPTRSCSSAPTRTALRTAARASSAPAR